MLGALSPAALERVEVEGEESTSEVIKLCSIITEQAKTIQRLESEVNHLRAQLQARAVAPVPTLNSRDRCSPSIIAPVFDVIIIQL